MRVVTQVGRAIWRVLCALGWLMKVLVLGLLAVAGLAIEAMLVASIIDWSSRGR